MVLVQVFNFLLMIPLKRLLLREKEKMLRERQKKRDDENMK